MAISFIGYTSQDIPYTGQSEITVKLVEDTQKLDEVVVTALGMKRDKKALGYAMQDANRKPYRKGSSPNSAHGRPRGRPLSTPAWHSPRLSYLVSYPVTGASVIVKGTTNGTMTDLDGHFTLDNVKKGDIIQISFIGYTSQDIPHW